MTAGLAERCAEMFKRSNDECRASIGKIKAEQSAKGALTSSITIIHSLKVFETHSSEGLKGCLESVSTRTDHRGRAWRKMLGVVDKALDEHLRTAPSFLEEAIKLQALRMQGYFETGLPSIEERLRSQLKAYRDGWTAPRPKPWNERHPLLYAVALLIIGAIVGAIGRNVFPS